MAEENKDNEFGDFEDNAESEQVEGVAPVLGADGMPVRVKMPRNGELIGMVMQRLGGNRMDVQCSDGKSRNCRVPGRFKRSMWLRPKDIVLVEPWPDDNSKADIIFKYSSSAINQLRKRGLLNNIKEEF